jgi:transposase
LDYSKFETVVFEHILVAEERGCDQCEGVMEEIGIEVKYLIKMVPARMVAEKHIIHVYGCRPCSDKNAEDGVTPVQIKKAQMPTPPLFKSCASPSLLAHIIHQKYSLAMPVYRIADDLKRSTGLTITRQTMGGWVIRSYERWLAMIYSLMKEEILKRDILHIDETEVQVLKEPGRTPAQKSYMWLFAGAECDVPLYLFEYHERRSREVVARFLKGWSGRVVTDGYAAYDDLGKGIDRISCLVHIRRHFLDVVKGIDKEKLKAMPNVVSLDAVKMINEMFHIDNGLNDMDAEKRKEARIEKLKPKMDAFFEWCLERRDEAAPKMALHKALGNAIEQWPYFENVLLDGRLPLDNNLAERSLRPYCIGRKNWLFSDTPLGAHASAAIYSIVTTAKANNLKPREYLEWLFEQMPNTENLDDKAVLAQFLPWSDAVPQSCRVKADDPVPSIDPLDEPIIDIDPSDISDVLSPMRQSCDCRATVGDGRCEPASSQP